MKLEDKIYEDMQVINSIKDGCYYSLQRYAMVKVIKQICLDVLHDSQLQEQLFTQE